MIRWKPIPVNFKKEPSHKLKKLELKYSEVPEIKIIDNPDWLKRLYWFILRTLKTLIRI